MEQGIDNKEARQKANNLKAIIIAAGKGSRMEHITHGIPKCMLRVGKKTLLQRAVDIFRECGIQDITVIVGYKKEKVDIPGIEKVENTDFENNNILGSLMYAKHKMDSPVITCYSDIIFDRSVVERLIASPDDISVIVDTEWKRSYEGRTLHPVEEAEKVICEDGKVIRIAKAVTPEEAHGEFIGMAKFSQKGVDILKSVYGSAKEKYGNGPFHTAKSFQKAYLTDMLQEIINNGHTVVPVRIQGDWMEMDTPQDLERAKKRYSS